MASSFSLAGKNGKELVVIGKGELYQQLLKKSHQNIKLLGWQSDVVKNEYLSNCKALIFPGIEDFGIVPLEAMSSGTPVLAFNQGGVIEYLQNNVNGLTFNEQSVDSINDCIVRFEKTQFESNLIAESIKDFTNERFKKLFLQNINENYGK